MFAKGFEPVGQVWGDISLLGRVDLVSRLNDSERVVNGEKEDLLANFEPREAIRLIERDGEPFIIAGDRSTAKDDLGVPLF
ncbi:MAG: hypothetical protein WBR18_07980 [Anaerolineales bacterium]